MGKDLIDVTGRVLKSPIINCNTPNVTYNGGTNADWSTRVKSLPMFSCAMTKSFVILCPNTFQSYIANFVQNLHSVARGMGFKLPEPQVLVLFYYILLLNCISTK